MVESNKKEKKEEFDFLNFENDPEVNKCFKNRKSNLDYHNDTGKEEVLMWSSKIQKYNKYNWVQERNFVIT